MAHETRLRDALALVAPDTALRDGLQRVLRGRTGGLVVIGSGRPVEQLANGGFSLDVPFTATALRELAKMDGAIIVSEDAERIVRAAVHLVPDPTLPTDEIGTRHRTADRVSRQSGVPVISVSASMHTIALYVDGARYLLEEPANILGRANQALDTLERYRSRLDEVGSALFALEIEDLATVRDVAVVVQRMEMVRRIAGELDQLVIELGSEGRLIALQLNELVSGLGVERELLVRDFQAGRRRSPDKVLAALDELADVAELGRIAEILGLGSGADALEQVVASRGYRMLARIPRLPEAITDRLIAHFGTLPPLLEASIEDLMRVEGVGESRARSIREGLSRLAESTLLERFV